MAFRFQRVLIACSLPTILAIVSFYWLRKRRKAIDIHSESPEHTSTTTPAIDTIDSNTPKLFTRLPQHSEPIDIRKSVSLQTQSSQTYCDLRSFDTEYEAMKLKDNKTSRSAAADIPTKLVSDTNSTAVRLDRMDSNYRSEQKRQLNCQTIEDTDSECKKRSDNELNNKYSVTDEKIMVKLANLSLNKDDNKDIQSCNGFEINGNNNEDKKSTKRDSLKCDKHCMEDISYISDQKESSNGFEANVSSHNDSESSNDYTNQCKPNGCNNGSVHEETISETNNTINNNNNTNSKQVVLDSIDAQNQNHSICPSNEITIEVNVCPTGDVNTPTMSSPPHAVDNNNGSSTCSSSASQCLLMTNGYESGDIYHNYPDSVSNGETHSPPHSAFSDVQSEGSSDSGKGGSDILHATPVEHRALSAIDETVVYQFEIPQLLCGRLIGEKGRFVTQIKRDTTTTVVINQHTFTSDMKICTLTGTRSAIKEALIMIRMRFPINHYPDVTLQQINLINASQTCPLPQTCQLQLPSGISCDVILSSLVSAGHFFLQQPTHPTYPSLSRLDHYMNQTYSQQNTPFLPNIHPGMICTVPIMGGWYRAVITKVYDTEECDVMFVDYGGFSRLPVSSLRQIRYDFMSLPFQASECYLANIEPIDSETGWTAEANALFEELAQGQILQAIVVGYADNGIPYVNLFKIQGISNVFINQELVTRSHAQWVESTA
ncbi:unnamed protein product [Medioppia subpectinata]|uniref:Tudor domain-containing protein n=1 Tax=Medioppia subpectinata TaxID=1979941 RepID=A0A7R9KPW2_9ACAR|nr:unnamed protein product [Medioppia subpectinata]CAG2107305.1 unnamed protein product [Medioppia subpectinata]